MRWIPIVITMVCVGELVGRAQTPAGETAAAPARPVDHVFVLMLDGTRTRPRCASR